MELELQGNAAKDLAGRRLEFTNPEPKAGLIPGFGRRQVGWVGDITASRRVRVPDVTREQLHACLVEGKPFPWHWGNALYLEWFSGFNGRVVIESTDFQLTIVGESEWELTPAEEEAQAKANAESMARFMAKVTAVVSEAADQAVEEPVMSEAEAERVEERHEQLMERVYLRMMKEGEGTDFRQVLGDEKARQRRERGEFGPDDEDEEDDDDDEVWLDQIDEAEPLVEEESFLAVDSSELPVHEHPLAAHARKLVMRMLDDAKRHGWTEQASGMEHPLVDLVLSSMKAGGKLAGTLFGRQWPPPRSMCATKIVRLKRVAGYFEDAMRAAEACEEQGLTEPAWIAGVRRELTQLTEETNALIAELREQLARTFE